MSSVASAMCCTPEPNSSFRKREASVWRLCEALRTRRKAPSVARDHLALHDAARIDHVLRRASYARRGARCRTEARSASPRSASTARDDRSGRARHRRRRPPERPGSKSTSQRPVEPLFGVDEIEKAAAEAAHRRDVELARPDRLAERLVEELHGPLDRRRRVVDLQRDGADRRAVRDVEGVGEAFLLAC